MLTMISKKCQLHLLSPLQSQAIMLILCLIQPVEQPGLGLVHNNL